MGTRITVWQTENPKELRRQLREQEDRVRELERKLEDALKRIKALEAGP